MRDTRACKDIANLQFDVDKAVVDFFFNLEI